MGVPGGHHRQGTVPADPTEGVHAAGCGLAPLPSWPPAPCPALRLLETSPTGDPSPEGAPGWHRGGSANISTQLDCRAGFPHCRMAPGTSTPRPTSSAPAGPHSAATTLHPRTRWQPQPSPPFPPGPGAGLGEVGSEASAIPPPPPCTQIGVQSCPPPRPAPPRTHSSCTSSSRRRGSHPTSPRAECRARVPGAAFYTRPSWSQSPVSRGTSLPDWFPTGSLSGSGLGDTGWAGG